MGVDRAHRKRRNDGRSLRACPPRLIMVYLVRARSSPCPLVALSACAHKTRCVSAEVEGATRTMAGSRCVCVASADTHSVAECRGPRLPTAVERATKRPSNAQVPTAWSLAWSGNGRRGDAGFKAVPCKYVFNDVKQLVSYLSHVKFNSSFICGSWGAYQPHISLIRGWPPPWGHIRLIWLIYQPDKMYQSLPDMGLIY